MNRWTICTALACAAFSAAASAADFETTLDNQTDVAVTAYNSGRALVRDRRTIKVGTGEIALRFKDVAAQIMPETVSLKSLDTPGGLRILEQNYEYDLMSPSKLMEKYVGKDIRLVNTDSHLNFTEIPAKLLSVNESPIYQIGKDIYLGHPGNVVLPEVPGNFLSQPTLVWLLQSDKADYQVEATYLTGGLSWKADYVLRMDKASKKGDLEGWVTLQNQSGATYKNAHLQLVAGAVNIVQPTPRREMMYAKAMAAPAAAPMEGGMHEEGFAEYHLYTLQRKTTINNNQTKQVSLLSGAGIAAHKTFELESGEGWFSQPMQEQKDLKPGVFLTFKNKEDNHLGMPLPGGVIRVYQEDQSSALQFAGEDTINHTPKDEDVRVKLGQAFDIVADRKQSDYRKIADRVHRTSYEISVRNHKAEDVTVEVIEHFGGDWELMEPSIKATKRDAATAVFSVPVAKDGETKLTYTVEVRY